MERRGARPRARFRRASTKGHIFCSQYFRGIKAHSKITKFFSGFRDDAQESREKLGFGPLGQGEHLGRFLDENG